MQNQLQLYNLSKATTPTDVVALWETFATSKNNLRFITTLGNYTNEFLPKDFIKRVFSEENDFLPYFQSPNLYFIDNDILKSVLSTKKNVPIPVDYSVMFDTQYATYVHNFVNNQTNKFDNDVWRSIDVLLRENFQYDYSFYIIENSKQIALHNTFNINDFKHTYKDIFDNIISLELFKSIDQELYKQEGKVCYTITRVEAEIRATRNI
ncbi:hypothetical protein ACTHOQ_15125 [Solibacillus silvestris]|uniref:hypothetical protein n=1 Tax=Solibacillus silvestris TaxID=76853 RepID=UPI003F809DB4